MGDSTSFDTPPSDVLPTRRRVHFECEPETPDDASEALTCPDNILETSAAQQPLQEISFALESIVPPHVNLSDRHVTHRYTQAPPTYLLGYFVNPQLIYEGHVEKGTQRETVQATLDAYVAFITKHTGMRWGAGMEKFVINGKEKWLFYAAQSQRREDIMAIPQSARNGFRRVTSAARDPMLIIYRHPKCYIS
ncbi:hypothetical protein BD626DRAFT_567508 [Schizophyllum amplum]|uniref:Uncharacterized protein n=1 Tax=Schizophyllum amplum TaxID=97359 RepID=A0A550CLC9_9AGAR|nr:hypothetical protein BD626DRAFT_567508 [Auriculariopsis ampla]